MRRPIALERRMTLTEFLLAVIAIEIAMLGFRLLQR